MQISLTRQCIDIVINSGSFPGCYSYCFTQRLPDGAGAVIIVRMMRGLYLVTRSSQLTMENITVMERRQRPANTAQHSH